MAAARERISAASSLASATGLMGWLITASALDQVASQRSSGAADDQQHGRAVIDLVLRLAADAHAAGLRLAVEHHDVGAARVEQPEQRG